MKVGDKVSWERFGNEGVFEIVDIMSEVRKIVKMTSVEFPDEVWYADVNELRAVEED